MTDHVLTTLLNRRAELAGDLDRAQGNVQQLKADLASLDAVIRQFDPAYNSEVIRPKYRRALGARLGSVGRTVLDTLRLADRPLSVKAIAEQVISARGLNAEDRALSRSIAKRVGTALRHQREKELVHEARGPGRVLLWAISNIEATGSRSG